jgi:N-acetylmuramoyl-L-alanine amidase
LPRELIVLFMKPDRYVERVFLHCSASDNPDHDDVSVMRRWHTDPEPEGRGWSDVGYHLFIRKSGQVQEGRPLSRVPAAQAGNNTGTIAICLHGLAEEKFTREQFGSLHDLSRQINGAYDAGVTFHGHCEVSAKLCPVFDYKEVLGLDGFGAIVGEGFRGGGTDGPDVPGVPRPVLRLTDQGAAVTVLQGLLNRRGANLEEDGKFGRGTLKEVLRFQAENLLVVDGIVGEGTWGVLVG